MRPTTRLLAATVAPLAIVGVGAAPASAATSDTYYADQYGPQQVRAEQAWATSTGQGTVVAVVDSGVDLGHPDLQGQLVAGATFVGCSTSCGNGDWLGGRSPPTAPRQPRGSRAGLASSGLPTEQAGPLATLITEFLDGRNASLTDGVQRALDRQPRDFTDFVNAAAASGVWDQQEPES